MFERYRLGYQLLLAVAAVEFALAFTLGMAPLTTYVKPGGFIGRMLPAWVVLPLLWAGLVAIEITRRQVGCSIATASGCCAASCSSA
jgi:hypothetical protein